MHQVARMMVARLLLPALGGLLVVSTALAASGTFSLFGSATVENGSVKLVSTSSSSSGISYDPSGTLKVSDITTLSANLDSGAECGAGSPRFSIDVGGGKHIFVYLGTPPNYTSCPAGNTGNLVDDADLVDTSQIAGGTFYDTWAHAKTLVGGNTVSEIDLVVDSGWNGGVAGGDGTQTVIVKSVTINGDTYAVVGPPTDKDQCKGDGWKTFNNPKFKNQGDCVSYVATHGRNGANPR